MNAPGAIVLMAIITLVQVPLALLNNSTPCPKLKLPAAYSTAPNAPYNAAGPDGAPSRVTSLVAFTWQLGSLQVSLSCATSHGRVLLFPLCAFTHAKTKFVADALAFHAAAAAVVQALYIRRNSVRNGTTLPAPLRQLHCRLVAESARNRRASKLTSACEGSSRIGMPPDLLCRPARFCCEWPQHLHFLQRCRTTDLAASAYRHHIRNVAKFDSSVHVKPSRPLVCHHRVPESASSKVSLATMLAGK